MTGVPVHARRPFPSLPRSVTTDHEPPRLITVPLMSSSLPLWSRTVPSGCCVVPSRPRCRSMPFRPADGAPQQAAPGGRWRHRCRRVCSVGALWLEGRPRVQGGRRDRRVRRWAFPVCSRGHGGGAGGIVEELALPIAEVVRRSEDGVEEHEGSSPLKPASGACRPASNAGGGGVKKNPMGRSTVTHSWYFASLF